MSDAPVTEDDTAPLVKFEYVGQTGQKVGFGLVVTGQVYEVTEAAAPVLEADADFEKLSGKAAEEADGVPGWPEPPTQPAEAGDAPASEDSPEGVLADSVAAAAPTPPTLDQRIISYVTPPPAARRARRSTSKK